MSEREREDDDVAWLLARAKGQPGPSISEGSAARYEKLEALLAGLPDAPDGAAPREGWQDRVFAAIDAEEARKASASVSASSFARALRKPWLLAVAVVAIATAAGIVALLREPAPAVATAPRVDVEIETSPSNQGAMGAAMVGDTLIVRAAIDGPGELRVYDDAGVETARCSAPAQDCTIAREGARTTLRLAMPLRARGAFHPILFSPPLGGASAGSGGSGGSGGAGGPGGIDVDVVAAGKAGIRVTRHDATIVR